jgi:GNAT superfamily N-acetyltransferase
MSLTVISMWSMIGSMNHFSPQFESRRISVERHGDVKGRPLRMNVRAAEQSDIDPLAQLWYDGWHDAHVPIVPAELTKLRTLDSFRERLQAALPNIRVIGPPGGPHAFWIIKGDEIYQFYVAASFRGSDTAAALMADAETVLAQRGILTAWLACSVGNNRAARFYEKHGWHRVGTIPYDAETSTGTFRLEVWRYEKVVSALPDSQLTIAD